MAYRILEQNGVDNTNIDGASFNRVAAANQDGIIRKRLGECNITLPASNVLQVATGEMVISGFRVVIDDPVLFTQSTAPATTTNYAIVARITVDSSSNVDFSLVQQLSSTALVKDDLFTSASGLGTYEVTVATFDLTTGLSIQNVMPVMEKVNFDFLTRYTLATQVTDFNFKTNSDVTSLTDGRVVYIELGESITIADGQINLSIDDGANYKPVCYFNGTSYSPVNLSQQAVVGRYYKLVYREAENCWVVVNSDGDFVALAGEGYSPAYNITDNRAKIDALTLLVESNTEAIAEGGQVLVEVRQTTPITTTNNNFNKLPFDTVEVPSSNTDVLNVDANNDITLVSPTVSSYTATFLVDITRTGGGGFTPFTVKFYLIDKSLPPLASNAFEEFTISVPFGGTTNQGLKTVNILPNDFTIPANIAVYYERLSGNGTISNGRFSMKSAESSGGAGQPKNILSENVVVPSASFVADTTWAEYGYRAQIAITGVEVTDVAYITYGPTQALSGKFGLVNDTYNGGVYIYATEVPASDITIPTILVVKGD